MSRGRIITSAACLSEGAAFLIGVEPRFEPILAQTAPLPLRLRADGFAALLDAIISQQVSVASARAISARLCAAGLDRIENMRAATPEDLRACGLSQQKIRYAKALGDADLDYAQLRQADSDAVIAALIKLPGIGHWTAEIYAMFSLGHADVFAPGDLALQEAARLIFAMPARPGEKDLRAMALAWAPWRSVAARLLWAYYRVAKQREGIT